MIEPSAATAAEGLKIWGFRNSCGQCTQHDSNGPCTLFDVYAHMGTIRVPLGNLGSVDGVRVVMSNKHPTTPFVLDSSEFAGSL